MSDKPVFDNQGGLWLALDPEADPKWTGEITINGETHILRGYIRGSQKHASDNPKAPTIKLFVSGKQ